MKKRYDVIVVGAGPAGLLAAKAAAENGLDVALLERKKEISVVKRSCGQSLVSMNEYYFDDLVHYAEKDRRICFPNTGFSFSYDGPVKDIFSWQFFSPGINKFMTRMFYSRGFCSRSRVTMLISLEERSLRM